MRYRPSSLPNLERSPCFTPDTTGNSYTDAGTKRHAALSAFLGGDKAALDSLSEDEQDGVRWAAEYINLHRHHELPIHCERRLAVLDDSFQEILGGTPDVVCGPDIFDLKWRYADYDAQLIGYALLVMDATGLEEVAVHVLYGQSQFAKRFVIGLEDAKARFYAINAKALAYINGEIQETVSDACGYCARKLSCPEMLNRAKAIVRGYADVDAIKEWHPSKMVSGEEIASAIEVSRVVSDWCESVSYHAKQFMERGGTVPGFELRSRAGKAFITSAEKAFPHCRVEQEQFLKACEVRLNTSKDYPDKRGIIDIYAEVHGMKRAPAKRELDKILIEAGVLMRGAASKSVVKISTSNQDPQDASIQES